MNRNDLINRLVARKINEGVSRRPICICMAQCPRKALCFASAKPVAANQKA